MSTWRGRLGGRGRKGDDKILKGEAYYSEEGRHQRVLGEEGLEGGVGAWGKDKILERKAYYSEEGGRYQRVLGEVGWEGGEGKGMIKY